MTIGVGTTNADDALRKLANMTQGVLPFGRDVFEQRLKSLQAELKRSGKKAIYLHAGTNLFYFTGLKWSPSERMVAAIVPAEGQIGYISPFFEMDTLRDYWQLEAPIHGWQEHECPYQVFAKVVADMGINDGSVLVDEVTPFFAANGLIQANPEIGFELGQSLTQSFRAIKSSQEIATIQRAHEMTLEVIKAAASSLKTGVSTVEVEQFIEEAHRVVGADAGNYFCIVLFGVATSFPHGVKDPQILKDGDWVLIDTGCELHGYKSDITRSFCFGEPTEKQRHAWESEKRAQLAVFEAAKVGEPCEVADDAARKSLVESGFADEYQLPGLPHRTGHGCGLDIHEGPNLVRGEKMPLTPGMIFSNEPMLVIPGEFGVRLEDHIYITEDGPSWFTEPCHSVDDPFGLNI